MSAQCDSCVYYVYDEDWECWVCTVGLDEDDVSRMMGSDSAECRYYRYDDEYGVVRKQN